MGRRRVQRAHPAETRAARRRHPRCSCGLERDVEQGKPHSNSSEPGCGLKRPILHHVDASEVIDPLQHGSIRLFIRNRFHGRRPLLDVGILADGLPVDGPLGDLSTNARHTPPERGKAARGEKHNGELTTRAADRPARPRGRSHRAQSARLFKKTGKGVRAKHDECGFPVGELNGTTLIVVDNFEQVALSGFLDLVFFHLLLFRADRAGDCRVDLR